MFRSLNQVFIRTLFRTSHFVQPTSTRSFSGTLPLGQSTDSTRRDNRYKPEKKKETLEEIVAKYNPEELQATPAMVQRILKEHKERGMKTIEFNNAKTMRALLLTLKDILKSGVHPAFVLDGCIKNPELFAILAKSPAKSWQILDCLVGSAGFTFEDAMRVFADYYEIFFAIGAENLDNKIKIFVTCGVVDYNLANIINDHVDVLYNGNEMTMSQTANNLLQFFSQNQRMKLLTDTPQILLQVFDKLEEKYEYIYFHMGIEGGELTNSKKWFELDLEDIMQRHQFLNKCGKYKMPDEKRPQLKMDNPRAERIFDTNDVTFAEKLAGVTVEEWNLFKTLFTKQKPEEFENKPFERINPKHRKAYARRFKESPHVEDHVFDESRDIIHDISKQTE